MVQGRLTLKAGELIRQRVGVEDHEQGPGGWGFAVLRERAPGLTSVYRASAGVRDSEDARAAASGGAPACGAETRARMGTVEETRRPPCISTCLLSPRCAGTPCGGGGRLMAGDSRPSEGRGEDPSIPRPWVLPSRTRTHTPMRAMGLDTPVACHPKHSLPARSPRHSANRSARVFGADICLVLSPAACPASVPSFTPPSSLARVESSGALGLLEVGDGLPRTDALSISSTPPACGRATPPWRPQQPPPLPMAVTAPSSRN